MMRRREIMVAARASRRWASLLLTLGTISLAPACVPSAAAPPSLDARSAARFASPSTPLLDEIATLEDVREPGARRLSTLAADSDSSVRARALRALARLQDPAALPAIARALSDGDARVRREAAFAVETLGLSWEPLDEATRAEAERAVLAALAATKARQGSAPHEESALLAALATVADDPAAAILADAVSRPSHEVAAAAARALGGWIHRRHRPWPSAPPARATSLTDDEARAIEGRAVELNDVELTRAVGYAAMRNATVVAKEKLPAPPTLRLLVACLASSDGETRSLGARGLAALPDGAQLARLAELAIHDLDWRVRVEAVRALAAASSTPGPIAQAAVAGLHAALVAALTEARQTPGPLGAMPLLALSEGTVPSGTIEALAREAPLLAHPFGDPATESRDQARLDCALVAAVARARLVVSPLEACGGAHISTVERERLIARTLGEAAFPDRVTRLRMLQRSNDRGARSLVAEALGKVGVDSKRAAAPGHVDDVTPLLLAMLADPEGEVVASAAEAAGSYGAPGATPLLVAALARFARPEDAEVLESIAAALGELHTSSAAGDDANAAAAAVAALTALLSHDVAAVRGAARKALVALGAPIPAVAASSVRASNRLSPPAESTLRLETDKGLIVIALAREEAPATTRAIANLARAHFYDGLDFHRVVPDFVAQGGDPHGDGWGGPGFTLRCELNPLRYERGAVGMALAGKDTGGSQLFIVHASAPHLDGKYTIIGRVVEGLDKVDALLPGDRIVHATVR